MRESAPSPRATGRQLERTGSEPETLFAGNLVRQPYMQGRNFRVVGDLAASDTVMRHTFWIGVFRGLGDPQIDFMIDRVRAFCRGG